MRIVGNVSEKLETAERMIRREGYPDIAWGVRDAIDELTRLRAAQVGAEETHEHHDARVQAALDAWHEALRTATVDEEQADTEWGAMSDAITAADKAGAAE